MYESDAKDATSLYVTCLDEDHQKNDFIGNCVVNLAKVLDYGEHDGKLLSPSYQQLCIQWNHYYHRLVVVVLTSSLYQQ